MESNPFGFKHYIKGVILIYALMLVIDISSGATLWSTRASAIMLVPVAFVAGLFKYVFDVGDWAEERMQDGNDED